MTMAFHPKHDPKRFKGSTADLVLMPKAHEFVAARTVWTRRQIPCPCATIGDEARLVGFLRPGVKIWRRSRSAMISSDQDLYERTEWNPKKPINSPPRRRGTETRDLTSALPARSTGPVTRGRCTVSSFEWRSTSQFTWRAEPPLSASIHGSIPRAFHSYASPMKRRSTERRTMKQRRARTRRSS